MSNAAPHTDVLPAKKLFPDDDSNAEFPYAEPFRYAVLRLYLKMQSNRSDSTLSESQFWILSHLFRLGPLNPSRLAEMQQVTPPSMNRALNALQARGLLTRQPHEDDARRVDIVLTPLGRRVLAETRNLRRSWVADRIRQLTDEERQAIEAAVPALERLLKID